MSMQYVFILIFRDIQKSERRNVMLFCFVLIVHQDIHPIRLVMYQQAIGFRILSQPTRRLNEYGILNCFFSLRFFLVVNNWKKKLKNSQENGRSKRTIDLWKNVDRPVQTLVVSNWWLPISFMTTMHSS